MPNRIVQPITWSIISNKFQKPSIGSYDDIPGPAAAAMASSPMKKSRSSVPRFDARWPVGPAPPVKNEGLLATAGRPEPLPPPPPAAPFVPIAVGKTKEGESLPAKPETRTS